MVKRLMEEYRLGDLVALHVSQGDSRHWVRGRVVEYDAPGIWVETQDGFRWFVTNGRRIRHWSADSESGVR